MKELPVSYKNKIHLISKRLMGKTSPLVAIRGAKSVSVDRIRELCAEIYILTDSILEVVESAERKEKGSNEHNRIQGNKAGS